MRSGRFLISSVLVDKQPEMVKRIMGQCIITRCEFVYMMGAFEYHAISDQFENVPDGFVTPEYEWVVFCGRPVAKKI